MNDREIVRSNPNARDYMDNFHINSHKNVLLLFEKTENNGKEAADGSELRKLLLLYLPKGHLHQCDQIARLCVQFLVIYNNENCQKAEKMPKALQNFAQY